MTTPFSVRSAQPRDAVAVTDIYNQGIAERGATFETVPRRWEEFAARIADTRYPLQVAVDRDDAVLGWAGLSRYRPRDCYAHIAEFSIYIDTAKRGRGIGRVLLNALIDAAGDRGYSKLVSRIFSFNAASRALCAACGFREVGVYERHGQLDGAWLDVVVVERLIATYSTPISQ